MPPCCESDVYGARMDAYIPGLEGPAGLPLVTQRLVARGWSDADVRKVLGGNVARLFRRELGRLPGTAHVP